MLTPYTFAGGSYAKLNSAKVILDSETGAPRLEDESDEQKRRMLIRLYYRLGNELCASYPSKHPEAQRGERLRSTAARLQAFPHTLFLRSEDAWGWGLMDFVVAPDLD